MTLPVLEAQFRALGKRLAFIVAAIGAALVAAGIAAFFMSIIVAVRNRRALADVTGDPWNGRTLEWATSSPPPAYNFAFTPVIHEIDAWSDMKKHGYQRPTSGFVPIHIPKNTGAGVVLSAISVALGFALVWHIWWMAGASLVALVGEAEHPFEDPAVFVGFTEDGDRKSWLLRQNGLHIELVIDPAHPVGKDSASGLRDVVVEAALTAIQDCEDSIDAVDAADKAEVYANCLA